ncbi:ABC transporter ATP-binding protein [Celerinatantimonas sp. YJH-8]|uniref:ABC transporter ATP-binding protein n=1 Tax=Celerinatantimonas sp. YJH-8 TaxID=3228714 RepID=UPI0038BE9028
MTQTLPPLLELQQISKHYPGVIANDQISLSLAQGEILALLGENGAGKSTLVKMIYGVTQPTSGKINWLGQPTSIKSPNQARQMGIGMVFQHFSVFETLTVAENIELGLDREVVSKISDLPQAIKKLSDTYDLHVDPQRYVHNLSIGERQRLEILRCLIQDVKLLILDEPTSVLTPQEVAGLFKVLRKLTHNGCSIMFISHKLKEVTELCDRAVILRGGKVSGECHPAQETPTSIARMMVGDDAILSETFPHKLNETTVLKIDQLTLAPTHPFGTGLKQINLQLQAGEILGIAGVAGNGQEDLLQALSGEDTRAKHHQIMLNHKPIGRFHSGIRRQMGMAYVPTDRLGQGAVPEMSLIDNTLLTNSKHPLVKFGWLCKHKISQLCQQLIQQNDVKCRNESSIAQSLSGGNLQKFILGREISQNPVVLICAHPTWGVDIGAASFIHRQLIQLRDQGAAIVVISEDIDELFMISDRLAALYEGQLSQPVPTAETSLEEVGQWIAGRFNNVEAAS